MPSDDRDRFGLDPTLYDELDHKLRLAAGPAMPVADTLQDFGRIVDEREKNSGNRPTDLAVKIAAMTAASSGAAGGQAASLIDVAPVPQFAKPLLARHLANYFAGGPASEAVRELARQVGGTIATEKGLTIDPERLIRTATKGAVSPRRAD
jgi:hypothetical protein